MTFIAAKKGEVAEGERVGEGVVGAGSGWVGSMEANTWCTRSHNGHWGWVSGWERWAWPRHGDGGKGRRVR